MKLFRPRTIWWPTWQGWSLLFLLAAGCVVLLIANVHGFLAVTHRVANADILVVEAWVPEKVAMAAAREFREGKYRSLVVTDLKRPYIGEERPEDNKTSAAVRQLGSYGVPVDRIIVCTGAAVDEHRSFAMASALRDAMRRRVVIAQGVNIVAPAAHARKTWLAYSRALRHEAAVGIFAVPTGDYDPAYWWRSSQGVKWVIANGAGWMHELIAGHR